MKVKILRDPQNVYEKDSVMDAYELIADYIKTIKDDYSLVLFLEICPKESALAYISNAWSLEFEIINS
jgi:hypothetical protein